MMTGKRKLESVRDPTEIYKSAKLIPNGHGRQSRVDQEGPVPPGDDEDDNENNYGPSAPDDQDDEDEDEDDEGRFFGGGMTRHQQEVLDFVPDDDAAPEKMDVAWLRRRALAFEKRIAKNAEQRAKHASEPARFIESEADLDADVRALAVLAEQPDLWAEFARLGCAASLVGLLAHDNTDVAMSAVEVLAEATGDDAGATEDQWGGLVDALLDADLLSLLRSNLGRLHETNEADAEGVYHVLQVLENLCSRPDTAEAVGKDDALLRWLLARAGRQEESVSQNKTYAAEVLAILVQASQENRRRMAALDAIDAVLQLLAPYRLRVPARGGEEEEYMENLFGLLTSLVDEPEGKARFVEAEGVELCLLMLKGAKFARPPALRLLDHAVGGAGRSACERLVEAGGLKTLFTLFVRTNTTRPTEEHLISVFSRLLSLLPTDSPERIRTLAKFVEKDYEKTAKLVRLRGQYAARVAAVDDKPGTQDDEDEALSRRLDAGLFCLQTIDRILAFLVAEDAGARTKIEDLLRREGAELEVLNESLRLQLNDVDGESPDAQDAREVLATLMEFLT